MPVHNEDIAAAFEEMADLLAIDDANPFRVRAYRNAARSVRGLDRELSTMLAAGEDLTRIPGIGKDLSAKIAEMVETGHVRALDRLLRELPASLEELLRLPGLGPKRVRTLYRELGIADLDQLREAAEAGRLRRLPGFGTKSERRLLEAIAARRGRERRFLRSVAQQHAEPLATWLRGLPGVNQVVIAGSYRRGRDTVGDIDILVTARDGSDVTTGFIRYEDVADVILRGHTRATVLLRNGLQADLRVVPGESFGAALHYFTGSKAHSIRIRRLGQQRGLRINEYGVYRDRRRIAGDTEDSVFAAVGLPWIPPELRENRGEIAAAREGRLPRLVERRDLRGDLHCHTDASDGHADLRTMALAARAAGLSYLAITDHTRHLAVAHGLDEDRLLRQIDAIDRLNEELDGITLLKGVEVDILVDGRLDLPDRVLTRLDLVVAAVHDHFDLPPARQTQRLLRAMDNRCFSILAHPTGRLLLKREGYALDMPRIVEAARERGCFLELNAQPRRLDLDDRHCRLARERGVAVSIDSDSHGPGGFANLDHGVAQARRGWLEKSDVLNTLPLARLRRRLRATMG